MSVSVEQTGPMGLDEILEKSRALRQEVADRDGFGPIDDPLNPVIMVSDSTRKDFLWFIRLKDWALNIQPRMKRHEDA